MAKEKVLIGCDDAAIDFKNEIRDCVAKLGYDVEDLGVSEGCDKTAYPHVAERVCQKIIDSGYKDRGILICGTGIGMAISANKCPGIRAAQTHDAFSAERAALSNDCHVITMGARVIGVELAKKIVKEWLPLKFKAGPSSAKVDAIMELEKKHKGKSGK